MSNIPNPKEVVLDDSLPYMQLVGMLLWMTKTRFDIRFYLSYLCRYMSRYDKTLYNLAAKVVKYLKGTPAYGLVFNEGPGLTPDYDKGVSMQFYVDSDFAGNKQNRISITGFCIFYNNCLVSWKSRGQKSVSLSSTEAEYNAMSEVCMEVIFIKNILVFLEVKLDYPILIQCDNVGAIYLAKNKKTSRRKKHIDARYHYLREYD